MTYPVELSKGQNIAIPDDMSQVDVFIGWEESDAHLDASALLLIGGRVPSDEHFVFFNQPASTDGSVSYLGRSNTETGPQERISIDLRSVPPEIETVTVAGSTDGIELGRLGALRLRVVDAAGAAVADFSTADADRETALVFAEVYRRDGRWKLRAVGQGWSSGLAGLATDFGVSVDNDSETDSVTHGGHATDDEDVAPTPAAVSTADEPAPPPSAENAEPARRRRRGVTTAKPAKKAAVLPVFDLGENESWQPARLFSVIGVGTGDEQERRATAALVSTMQAVKPFARAICGRLGAPVGRFEGYIEVAFTKGEGKVMPDAVFRVARGSRTWTALLEVKTGTGQLRRDQLENYLDVARRQKYDTVVSLSNDVPAGAGELPVEVDRRKLTKVGLRHLSWADVSHEARMLLAHGGIEDGLQAWMVSELLRYLAHPRSGAVEFADMGPHWVTVRDRAADGTLRAGDTKAAAVADKWLALSRHLAQRLTADLGVPVKHVLPRRLTNDASARTGATVEKLADEGVFSAVFRIPETAGDLNVTVDLRRAKVTCTTTVVAPDEGTALKRTKWIVRQLEAAPPDLLVEALFSEPGVAACDTVAAVRADPKMLANGREGSISSFVLHRTSTMSGKRSGTSGFVQSVVTAVDAFYGDVLQQLREWVPAAPHPADFPDPEQQD